jgi:hypothetical protein
MPEGNDFVDELVVMFEVDAVAEGSFKYSPAGLLPSRRKKRRIAPNMAFAGHALHDGDIWMLTLRWPLDLTSVALGRLKQLLLEKAKELHASAVMG